MPEATLVAKSPPRPRRRRQQPDGTAEYAESQAQKGACLIAVGKIALVFGAGCLPLLSGAQSLGDYRLSLEDLPLFLSITAGPAPRRSHAR